MFSRAVIERFAKAGNRDVIITQVQCVLKKNGGADIQGSGGKLGEYLNYVFMKEKLDASKLMSRVEIDTDGKQYKSVADSIHMLTNEISGRPYHQIIFGTSNIVGDPVMPSMVPLRKYILVLVMKYHDIHCEEKKY